MAFQSVPETSEIAVIYTKDGAVVQNTFHAQYIGGYDASDLESMAEAIDNQIGSNWLDDLPDGIQYLRTEVRGLENEEDYLRVNSDSTGFGGVVVSTFPNQVTIAVKKLSALTGRSARGRFYWPALGVSQVDEDENTVKTAHQAVILANAESLRQTIINQGAVPVIVSRFHNGAKRATGVTVAWIAVSLEDGRVDTQRRRLP